MFKTLCETLFHSDSPKPSETKNRRETDRVVPKTAARNVVIEYSDGYKIPGWIADVSPTGIGVFIESPHSTDAEKVKVYYQGKPLAAQIVRVNDWGVGARVGMEWLETAPVKVDAETANSGK